MSGIKILHTSVNKKNDQTKLIKICEIAATDSIKGSKLPMLITDVCPLQGDSGGPLMCESSGVWYQVGIVPGAMNLQH